MNTKLMNALGAVGAKTLVFLKNWTLPVAICWGAIAYFAYTNIPLFDCTRPYAPRVVAVVQPVLIFSMLFLSFCKVDVRTLRPRITHLWLLLIQCGSFAAMCLALHFCPDMKGGVLLEAALLCLICPTATSAAVVTQKLHGDSADIVMYTLIINLAVSLIVPALVPLVHPHGSLTFTASFVRIMAKVFPMLICPLIAAQLVRTFFKRLHARLVSVHDLAFYIWAVALSIAISVTARSIAHTNHSILEIAGIALVSFVCCYLQFFVGRMIGRRYGLPISTCQGLGQKNTVFAIWMGYTFMNPITSIAGGFYSIWHNVYNTIQLRQTAKRDAEKAQQ